MRRLLGVWCVWLLATVAPNVLATEVSGGDTVRIQDLTLTVPQGWQLKQNAKDEGTIILGFANGAEYFTMYVKQTTGLDMKRIFNNGTQIVRDTYNLDRNQYHWKLLDTSKPSFTDDAPKFVTSFLGEHQGFSYYGYTRVASQSRSAAIVSEFLGNLN